MKIVLTNLANKLYESSRFQLNGSARKQGIREINSYDFEDLKSTSFYVENKNLLDKPRGIGYWCWKPYIILETMRSLSDGDLVIYSDCGIEMIAPLDPLIAICKNEQPILLFANENFKNAAWTKRDCFVLMDCDSKKYSNGLQCDAAFSMYRKSAIAIQFLEEWLRYCCDERVVGDLPNSCGKKNYWGFQNHRWDQSVLSLLAIKYEIEFYRVPTQFGNHYKSPGYRIPNEFNCINQNKSKQVNYYTAKPYFNSPYFQLLNHHRTKISQEPVIESKKSIVQKIIISGKRRWGKIIKFLTRS
jgi:hypothetical protein